MRSPGHRTQWTEHSRQRAEGSRTTTTTARPPRIFPSQGRARSRKTAALKKQSGGKHPVHGCMVYGCTVTNSPVNGRTGAPLRPAPHRTAPRQNNPRPHRHCEARGSLIRRTSPDRAPWSPAAPSVRPAFRARYYIMAASKGFVVQCPADLGPQIGETRPRSLAATSRESQAAGTLPAGSRPCTRCRIRIAVVSVCLSLPLSLIMEVAWSVVVCACWCAASCAL